jgi:hypothetical protein
LRVKRILTALCPRVGNPGLKLANSFGVEFNSDLEDYLLREDFSDKALSLRTRKEH